MSPSQNFIPIAYYVDRMTVPRRSKSAAPAASPAVRRRWRDYKTASGRSPVREFIDDLHDPDAAAVLVGMEEVRDRGLRAARHLDGDIWEVRVAGDRVIYRILFAQEGVRGQVLLALEGFNKKSQKTPPEIIKLAEGRLADWRRRGEKKRRMRGARRLPR